MFNQYVSKNKNHEESLIFFSSKMSVLNEKRYNKIFYFESNFFLISIKLVFCIGYFPFL